MARIGVLVGKLYVGGVEKIAIEEVRALNELGHDSSLLVLVRTEEPTESFGEALNGINVVYLSDRLSKALCSDAKIPFLNFFSLFHLTYPLLLPSKVKRNEYDLIISHNAYNSFTAYALSKLKKIPYAIYVHDPIHYILGKVYTSGVIKLALPVLLPVSKWIDKQLTQNSVAVFTGSNEHAKYLEGLLSNPGKVKVLVPGYTARNHLRTGARDYFITITAWKQGKQLEKLLPIIAELEGAKLKVVGKWIHEDYRIYIEKEISRLGITPRVSIVGAVSEHELADLYAAARAALIINDEKGFGMPGMEAAGNGTPFIAPSDCGIASLFSDEVEASYFPAGNMKTAKAKISELLFNPEKASTMGQKAWEKCRSQFSWGKHAWDILDSVGERSSAWSVW